MVYTIDLSVFSHGRNCIASGNFGNKFEAEMTPARSLRYWFYFFRIIEGVTRERSLLYFQLDYVDSLLNCYVHQRKDIYIEHRAGKAARLASWRKMTQPGEFCW
jgi:hypothetical protein